MGDWIELGGCLHGFSTEFTVTTLRDREVPEEGNVRRRRRKGRKS